MEGEIEPLHLRLEKAGRGLSGIKNVLRYMRPLSYRFDRLPWIELQAVKVANSGRNGENKRNSIVL